MSHAEAPDSERSVLRWGGLAGMAGAALMLIVFAIVGALVGGDPAHPEGLVARFPAIRAARILENGLYLGVMALWAVHVAALSEVLRGHRLAAALFGRTLATFGLILLAAGALVHLGTAPISDVYHGQGATPAQQAALVPLWLATQGIFDALLVAGLLVLPLGIMALGVAMRSVPAFGTLTGSMTVVLGAIGFAAALVNLVAISASVAVCIFAFIVFNLLVGWKAYRMSRQPGWAVRLAPAPQGA